MGILDSILSVFGAENESGALGPMDAMSQDAGGSGGLDLGGFLGDIVDTAGDFLGDLFGTAGTVRSTDCQALANLGLEGISGCGPDIQGGTVQAGVLGGLKALPAAAKALCAKYPTTCQSALGIAGGLLTGGGTLALGPGAQPDGLNLDFGMGMPSTTSVDTDRGASNCTNFKAMVRAQLKGQKLTAAMKSQVNALVRSNGCSNLFTRKRKKSCAPKRKRRTCRRIARKVASACGCGPKRRKRRTTRRKSCARKRRSKSLTAAQRRFAAAARKFGGKIPRGTDL